MANGVYPDVAVKPGPVAEKFVEERVLVDGAADDTAGVAKVMLTAIASPALQVQLFDGVSAMTPGVLVASTTNEVPSFDAGTAAEPPETMVILLYLGTAARLRGKRVWRCATIE